MFLRDTFVDGGGRSRAQAAHWAAQMIFRLVTGSAYLDRMKLRMKDAESAFQS
jgi:hypothetical protein